MPSSSWDSQDFFNEIFQGVGDPRGSRVDGSHIPYCSPFKHGEANLMQIVGYSLLLGCPVGRGSKVRISGLFHPNKKPIYKWVG